MSSCSSCGQLIEPEARFCTTCGAQQHLGEAPSSTNQQLIPSPKPRENAFEIGSLRFYLAQCGAAAWLILAFCLIILTNDGATWGILLAPSIIASLWPLLRNNSFTRWIDRREAALSVATARASAKSGKFARFVSAPTFRACLWIWRKTSEIANPHFRTCVRVGAILYFLAAALFILVVVGYVIVIVVVMIAVLLLLLWLAGSMLSGKPLFSGGRDDEPSPSWWASTGDAAPAVTRPARDWMGNPKADVFNRAGAKIMEVRPTADFFGNPKEELIDTEGRKIGERRPSADMFGNPKIDEFDQNGIKIGENHATTDFLGNAVEEHRDNDDNKVGESRQGKDWLGNPVVRHTREGS